MQLKTRDQKFSRVTTSRHDGSDNDSKQRQPRNDDTLNFHKGSR